MRPLAVRLRRPMTNEGGEVRIRAAVADDADAFAAVGRVAFNVPASWVERVRERFRAERVLLAERDGRIVATSQGFRLHQWFGGRPLPTVGIASVATDPVLRGSGIAPRLLRALMERARTDGMVLASLYPATVPVYRRLGFEYAAMWTTYRVPVAALPAGPSGGLVEIPQDRAPVVASYRRLAGQENGLVEGLEDDWWPTRVFHAWSSDATGTVMTETGEPGGPGPAAYASYALEDIPDEFGYRVRCSHLVAHDREAALALLGYFRRFKGLGMELMWHGPPVDPIAMLFAERAVRPVENFPVMSRILDVAGALEARGYAPVSGRAVLRVADPEFPGNDGAFEIEAEDGVVRAGRTGAGGEAGAPVAIGALTAMFTGHVTPRQAVRLGLIDPDLPAIRLLEALLAGPPAWLMDFF